ncbi:hypothetical protein COCC4DRAFT_66816 [Bipolaris maydis ATCC 48331]|uniref:PNPLA domain-containing protein n=2 Tax=Cochliobolus heterostrophus TaxID=5016 RepID=M2SJX3_COCH5|nr:uncharacterized protein COCC4DRAFT_66816 [Bipolaris maydis ATCC 48331]EMD85640.1 hypothetical protein COCHEDRAFT_1161067 [Bipolaris maydis C5]ENH99072.1 hypothetical protein COCC4DRAFT_66816 [Bipolaris maydis ATCC 48331]KAJ6208605.1 acyl transferase/acyl hydrolase/lysophospholipase [Bipolaris maydis]
MSARNSSDWLYGFQTGTDWFLTCGGALQRAIASLYDPHAHFPSTVLLIGKREKESAIQALLPGRANARSRGIAQLEADSSTLDDKHPLLVASVDLDNACSKQKPLRKQNGRPLHKIRWLSHESPASETDFFVEIIVGRLLLSFIDVVCLFLDDFSTREEGIQFLQRCTNHARLSKGWKPRIILVTSSTYRHRGYSGLPTFGSIQRVVLPALRRKAPSSRFFALERTILSGVEMVRKSRSASRMLYSAHHLNVFFESALGHTASCISTPFNFILATRQCNPVEDHLWLYLQKFLRLCIANQMSQEATLEYMASAIMLNSLPPGMHRGLIVLMFLLRRNIAECITTFKKLSKRVFSPSQSFRNSILAKFYGFITTLLTDSIYGAGEIEAYVKEVFGSDTTFFSFLESEEHISGPKVAVTTMTVSSSRLCILSNYNGVGVRQGRSPRPRLMARATSAAPSYFLAKFIRGLGFLQDGGAGKYNNPIDPAEWESKAIWDTAPDMIVSIGTGFARDPESPEVILRRLGFRDRFFPRLFRLFNAEHLNGVPRDERHKYFRINIPLSKEPLLDDVSKMPELEGLASNFLESYDFSSLTQALFVNSFFFELFSKPVTRMRSIVYSGSIRCRSPDTRALVERILEEYPNAAFTTEDGTSLGRIDSSSIYATCGYYCKTVQFKAYHVDQRISIYLQFSNLVQHNISGFPQSLAQLIRLQLLDADFGRPDHRAVGYAGRSRRADRKALSRFTQDGISKRRRYKQARCRSTRTI